MTASSPPPRAPVVLLVAEDSMLERAIATVIARAGVEVLRARTVQGATILRETFAIDATVAVVSSPSDPLIALAHQGRGLTCAVAPVHHCSGAAIRGFDVIVPFTGDAGASAALVLAAVAPASGGARG